jgi:aminoglycoside phosphotransferase (APT) family kinase protein
VPVPRSRAPEQTADGLARWCQDTFPGRGPVRVELRPSPRASGFSCETVLFDVEPDVGGRQELAARVHPTGYSLYRHHDLDRQWRIIDAVGRARTVPVPAIVGADTSGLYLGQPFFVMARLPGETCADSPPYSVRGWLKEAGAERQREVAIRSIEVLAAIHAVDATMLPPQLAAEIAPGIAAQVADYSDFLAWVADGRKLPLFEDTYDWLRAELPPHTDRLLCWGDARIGNMLFVDDRPSGVLDWEMACLGPPEVDLAWWLVFDLIHTVGRGLPGLPGFPSESETVDLYQSLTGHEVRSLHWYEVWAALRATVLLFRFHDMLERSGLAPTPDRAAYQPGIEVLRRLQDRVH